MLGWVIRETRIIRIIHNTWTDSHVLPNLDTKSFPHILNRFSFNRILVGTLATREVQCGGAFLTTGSGKIGSVCVPTADARILSNGTAFISDLGMCGDYDSIIGMDKNKALERFKKKTPIKGIHPATGEATLSCVYVDLDDKTGLAKSIKQIIKGGSLEEIS